jgi:hypothetical protein
VAAQPELGLLPEQRTGLAGSHSGCPAFAGQNLNRMGGALIGAKEWSLNGSNAGQVAFPGGGLRNDQERQIYVTKH